MPYDYSKVEIDDLLDAAVVHRGGLIETHEVRPFITVDGKDYTHEEAVMAIRAVVKAMNSPDADTDDWL